eukprot:PhM_4_TR15587/c0_g1_i1/m.64364
MPSVDRGSGGVCPEGAQGYFSRKYIPNAYILAGQSSVNYGDHKAQRLDVEIVNPIKDHDKLWSVGKNGDAKLESWVTGFRFTLANALPADWHFVKKHTLFMTTSLELKTRVVRWRFFGGYTNEVVYKNHYYEEWARQLQRGPSVDFCAGENRHGLQGYLVVISTKEESDNTIAGFKNSAWLGADDIVTEGLHRWVVGPERQAHAPHGPTFSHAKECQSGWYCNWRTGQPDNARSGEDVDQFIAPKWGGRWNDGNVENTIQQVCEFGGVGVQSISQGTWYLEPSCAVETSEAGCESYQMCSWNSETAACEENECR